jgi:hypothetical protein
MRTYASQEANGAPWSRAKANSCRDAVATMERLQNMAMKMTSADKTVAPA